MNEKEKKIIAIVSVVAITSLAIAYMFANGSIPIDILGRDDDNVNNAYADVTLVSPKNYALVDIPVTVTVHVVTNATNPLIQFTFKYVKDGYDYYYRSLRMEFTNDTDVVYTPTFDEANTPFSWYVTIYNGSSAIWYNDNNMWHFTTKGISQPVADAGGPYNGIVGVAITLDGSNSHVDGGSIVRYQWDTNNDGIYDAEGETVSVIYDNSGNYTVTLKVTDNNGNTDTDTTYIVITAGGSPIPLLNNVNNNTLILIFMIVAIITLLVIGIKLYLNYEKNRKRR